MLKQRVRRQRLACCGVFVALLGASEAAAQQPGAPEFPQPPDPPANAVARPTNQDPPRPSDAQPKDEPATDPRIAAKVEQLISELDSASFQEREQATQALQELGVPAVKALAKVMPGASPEVAIRGVYVLGVISTSGDPDVQAAARDALDEIVSFDTVAAAYARDTLGTLERSMRRRAIDELRQLARNCRSIVLNKARKCDKKSRKSSWMMIGREKTATCAGCEC